MILRMLFFFLGFRVGLVGVVFCLAVVFFVLIVVGGIGVRCVVFINRFLGVIDGEVEVGGCWVVVWVTVVVGI